MQKIKDFLKEYGWTILGFTIAGLLVVAILGGLIWLYVDSKRESRESCAEVARIIKASDYKADNFECRLVKDGKIVEMR